MFAYARQPKNSNLDAIDVILIKVHSAFLRIPARATNKIKHDYRLRKVCAQENVRIAIE